jgi:hypothetical protein
MSSPPPRSDSSLPVAATDTRSAAWRMAAHWPELVVAITEQSASSAAHLLRGLDLMVQRGRLTPAEHKVLAMPAERLKLTGMHAQQIVRLQSGQARQSHEKIDLAYLTESVLQERRDELAMMGIVVRRKFEPVDVLIDPALGFSLVSAMLEWSVVFGHRIDLRLDLDPLTQQARLWMKTFAEPAPAQSAIHEDTLPWLLLSQLAATDGGIALERTGNEDGVSLCALFRRTLSRVSAPAPLDNTAATAPAPLRMESVFKSITGAFVLICSADATTCEQAVAIVRKLGVPAEAVAHGEAAIKTLRERDVDLLVLDREHPVNGTPALEEELGGVFPLLPVVQLGPRGSAASDHDQRPQIPYEALQDSLGSTVMFTLSKVV